MYWSKSILVRCLDEVREFKNLNVTSTTCFNNNLNLKFKNNLI